MCKSFSKDQFTYIYIYIGYCYKVESEKMLLPVQKLKLLFNAK